jgi:hypothetical protein
MVVIQTSTGGQSISQQGRWDQIIDQGKKNYPVSPWVTSQQQPQYTSSGSGGHGGSGGGDGLYYGQVTMPSGDKPGYVSTQPPVIPNQITSRNIGGQSTSVAVASYQGQYGTSADRPITSQEMNRLGGSNFGSKWNIGGYWSPSPTGRGTSMGNVPPMTVGRFVETKLNENQLKVDIAVGKNRYNANQGYNKEVDTFYNTKKTEVDSFQKKLEDNPILNVEQKTKLYTDYLGATNKELESFQKTKATEYQTKFVESVGSDKNLVGLGNERNRIVSGATGGWTRAGGLGVNIGSTLTGQTTVTGSPQLNNPDMPKLFSTETARDVVTTFIPATKLVDGSRSVVVRDIKTAGYYDFTYGNVKAKPGDVALVGLTGIGAGLMGTGMISSLSKEIAAEKAANILANPTKGLVTSLEQTGKLTVNDWTFFKPNKAYTFKLTPSEVNKVGMLEAFQSAKATNPLFGKDFNVAGAGWTKTTFSALPENVKVDIAGAGLKPATEEVFAGKATRNFGNIPEDNTYLKAFVESQKNLKSNQRLLVGGTFEQGGKVQQLMFIQNPVTGTTRFTGLKGVSIEGDVLTATRNTFRKVTNKGLPSRVFNIGGGDTLGIYPEGDLFRQVSTSKVIAKLTKSTQASAGGKTITSTASKGISADIGKTSGTFTGEEALISGQADYIPRITRGKAPTTYTEFNTKQISVLNEPEYGMDILKGDVADIAVPKVSRGGPFGFTGTAEERLSPIGFSKGAGKGKQFEVPTTSESPITNLANKVSSEYKAPMDKIIVEPSQPSIVGGSGQDLFSQAKYGSRYGEFGGGFKGDVNLLSTGLSGKDMGFNKLIGPRGIEIGSAGGFNGALRTGSTKVGPQFLGGSQLKVFSGQQNKMVNLNFGGLRNDNLSISNQGFNFKIKSNTQQASGQGYSFKNAFETATITATQLTFPPIQTPFNFNPKITPDGFNFRGGWLPKPKAEFDSSLGSGKLKITKKRRYTPSAEAIFLGIRGKKPTSKSVMALGTRPIPKGFSWYKRRRM